MPFPGLKYQLDIMLKASRNMRGIKDDALRSNIVSLFKSSLSLVMSMKIANRRSYPV